MLSVQHVVEGSVRRSGDRLRVTAQLIRAEDGFHLWSETYDTSSDDVISIQEDLAIEIEGRDLPLAERAGPEHAARDLRCHGQLR